MAYAKGVVFAFGDPGKAADAPRLAQRPKPVLAARHKLMGIRLMPYVPDDLVPRGVEHGVQSQGELDDPEARSQMASCDRDSRDDLLADLFRQLGQSLDVQPFEILRRCDAIQNSGHGFPSLSRDLCCLANFAAAHLYPFLVRFRALPAGRKSRRTNRPGGKPPSINGDS